VTLSRKEFLARGLVAFGRDLVRNVSGVAAEEPAPAGEEFGQLLVDNRHCLAQRGGCFACIDHCPREAISIQLGVGIAVDAAACDGCGQCVEHCPLEPKVIALKPLPTT
jgi:Pyruvate/2-oxoacid:ferredoxin oxidoreductase delta subunit